MTSPDPTPAEFWKRKLAALLHDPPSKCLNLGEHEAGSARAMAAAGLDQTKYPRLPDWEASAADRLPFPKSRPSAVSCAFDGVRAGFHHPLGGPDGQACELRFDRELGGLDQLEGEDSTVQPVLAKETSNSDRDRFFAHWRLWRQWAQEKDWRFGFLPADTRIPDHTIWHHMQVTSALAGCAVSDDPAIALQPAFLKVQVGPVQDFIAAAKSTRDLWSGSYLLSWLMAAGLKHLSQEVGPDAVLFPSLWGQPLFDLHWKESLWDRVAVSHHPRVKTCWDAIAPSDAAILTPNLPNVFLALVPAARAETLATQTAAAIRAEFRTIAESVWKACADAGLMASEEAISADQRKARFDEQIARFLTVSWQVTPWAEDLEHSLTVPDGFDASMPMAEAGRRVQAVRDMAEKLLPADHRDSRYYHNTGRPESKIHEPARLKQRGLAWSVLLARNAWELDAVRSLRDFPGTVGEWQVGTFQNKDFLTGKDEAVAGGRFWMERTRSADGSRIPWTNLFRKEEWMGAVTLVKRVWHLAYLRDRWKLPTRHDQFPMPNVRGIAAHEPFSNDEAEEPETGEKYFAVLAFDGDEIGKWISGANTPTIRSQLADYPDGSGTQTHGMREYFERSPELRKFLTERRAVSPSYHLQFSEALGNFALYCAASVVEAHDGRLIYCGGDDVLAMVPADTALACAEDLVAAFQGQAPVRSVKPRMRGPRPDSEAWVAAKSPGFLLSGALRESTGRLEPTSEGSIPFVVPGPRATASVGIAMAHFKTPLQDVVRAAQRAEKRAKNQLGRAALSVTLFKRSGEISEWGCRFASGGLALYRAIARLLEIQSLSAKFPHRVCELLAPYLTARTGLFRQPDASGFQADEVIRREFSFAVMRQSGPVRSEANLAELLPLLDAYLEGVRATRAVLDPPPRGSETQELLEALSGLCTAVAFADRNRPGSETSALEPTRL